MTEFNNAAVINADFVNFKHISGRKTTQLIFEVPHELTQHALNVLGIPGDDESHPVVIAKLYAESEGRAAE